MKLEAIHTEHVQQAANQVDRQGIPKDYVWSQYYIVVDEKEYPFRYLIRTAYDIATGETIQLQTSDSYRKYIEELGIEICYYENGYNFFTQEELAFYHSIAQEDYRKNNPNQKYYGQKLYPIIAKVNYWAEQLLIDGFKLKKDNNWLTGHTARIAPYIWPRIYQREDKDIFFNVEVNGVEQFIGYKLDKYTATNKALPKHKLNLVQEYFDSIDWEWPTISFDQLHEYNWEKLITESREYVRKNLPHHNHLKKLLDKESKIARIAWNTNGWVKPSGPLGKSQKGFEYDQGFGYEEWLFDGDKTIDGFKYGFLQSIHKHRSRYEGKVFDLSLFTRNHDSKQKYWVTTLRNVEVLEPEESQQIYDYYKREGWYDEMKADLIELGYDEDQLDLWIKKGSPYLFNVKFTASQLNDISDDLIPVIDSNDIPADRYLLMNIPQTVQEKYEKATKTGFSFKSGSKDANLSSRSVRKGKRREVELELKHNMLQTKFLQYLQSKYGRNAVRRECKAYGSAKIDVVQKTKTGFIFYEIKTYNSLKSSIREGIGQLLEYCLYPSANEAEKIVLVSHVSPSEEVKKYINHLKTFIRLPFSYIHFDIDKEEIISEL